MEGLSYLEGIIVVIIGMFIFELLYFLLNYLIVEKEETIKVDQEAEDYLQHIISDTVAKATDPNKED